MVFSSMIFLWLFLPILLILYFLAKEKYRNTILLIFSLLFYAFGEPKYVFLMLFSIFINYCCGLVLAYVKSSFYKRLVLILSIFINLSLLGYFKYFDFVVSNINRLLSFDISLRNIVLPIGISFYTFQAMSYVIDLYRGHIKVQKNFFDLALYVSFFPQLIAGPIVKYHDIDEQLKSRCVSVSSFASGIRRFVYGLGKKIIFANSMAYVADFVFNINNINYITTPIVWFGIICYTLQIYFDFSGYSDMAIGLGRMFGFRFMENFNLPYISESITDFWRRWHISLSTWFREYLYIPLGGNRKGKIRTYINLFIVFFATGFWHGASWSFIIWGLFHGFFMIIERLGLKKLLDKNKFKLLNHLYVMLVVMIGWVMFRAEGFRNALIYLKTMFEFDFSPCYLNLVSIINLKTLFLFVLSILFAGILQVSFKRIKDYEKIQIFYQKYLEGIVIFFILLICIMMLVSNTYNPFIYFRF